MAEPIRYPTDVDFAVALRGVEDRQLARVLESVMLEFEHRGIYALALEQLVERIAHRRLALKP